MFTGKYPIVSMKHPAYVGPGVVVESFSFVFQVTSGTRLITREEMRAFKKAWAESANENTGYLEKTRLALFLSASLLSDSYVLILIVPMTLETERRIRGPHLPC